MIDDCMQDNLCEQHQHARVQSCRWEVLYRWILHVICTRMRGCLCVRAMRFHLQETWPDHGASVSLGAQATVSIQSHKYLEQWTSESF